MSVATSVNPRKHNTTVSQSLQHQGKESTMESTSNSQLLRLPHEIRHQIIRHFVFCTEPLRQEGGDPVQESEEPSKPPQRSRSFSFFPEILRVCRQMYNEGTDILYNENVVDIQLELRAGEGWSRVLGYDFDDSDMQVIMAHGATRTVREKMKKWRVVLEIKEQDDLLDVRKLIRNCCMMLSDMLELQHLTVSIQDRRPSLDTSNTRAIDIIRPFQVLRNLNRVDFVGVHCNNIENLVWLMCSSQPVVDLPKMSLALEEFIENLAPENESLEAIIEEVCDAVDQHDVVKFRECRRNVMERVMKHVRKEQIRLYRHDPV